MKCPRRVEDGTDRPDSPFTWANKEDKWRSDGTCSYCGSISPRMLFEAIADGKEIGPTDKNYKVYVKGLNVRGAGKFYFQHFDEDNKNEFIRLLNEDKINIGFPGRFYVLPFFIKLENK